MTDYDDEVFALPVSGHYDCGYSYGSGDNQTQQSPKSNVVRQSIPVRNHSSHNSLSRPSHLLGTRPRSPPTILPASYNSPRPRSPPMVLPQAYTIPSSTSLQSTNTPVYFSDPIITPTTSQIDLSPPPLPPKPWSSSNPTSPSHIAFSNSCGSDSDLSTLSSRSRQASTQSVATASSSLSSSSYDKPIEPDPLPSHSNPQWLSPTQSAAFAGPRPIQPMRLRRREVCDSYTGDVIFRLSDETKLKLSRQAIYQIYEPESSAIVGTLGYPTDANDEVAAILRGQDVVLKKESSSSNRWCFKPSSLIKKGAFWYWYKDKVRGDIVLSDAKKGGVVMARIQRDVLSFERPGLGLDTVNEICFSAMALAEMARRSSSYEDAPNLAAAIAVVALNEAADEGNGDDNTDVIARPRRAFTLSLR